jgi:hypothetical protein
VGLIERDLWRGTLGRGRNGKSKSISRTSTRYGTGSSRGTMSTSSDDKEKEKDADVFLPLELLYDDAAASQESQRASGSNERFGTELLTWRRWSRCFSANSSDPRLFIPANESASTSTSTSTSSSLLTPPSTNTDLGLHLYADMSSSATSLAQRLELGASDATLKMRSSA